MTLPKPKEKKLIPKDFDRVAEEVKKTLEEQCRYLREKKLENGSTISPISSVFA